MTTEELKAKVWELYDGLIEMGLTPKLIGCREAIVALFSDEMTPEQIIEIREMR